ncbi:proline/serine-rich protein [Pisolithus thermaeus]|nr:proline/serine-rich protein [Pisolithus thermaeus]
METQTPRPTPNSPKPAVQGSPRTRDLSNLRAKEAGSALRGTGRERAGRGNRGGRGGGRQRNNLTVSSKTETSNSLASSSNPHVANKLPDRVIDGTPERVAGKAQSRLSSRGPPAVVVVHAPEASPVTPSGSPRLSNHRRRSHQQGKGQLDRNLKPLSSQASLKSSKSRNSSTLSSSLPRKDVPPHLAITHEAEVRHDIEALVERVRAVAMAENRPTTPGSHIDWAGDEDDSLPDLDDWGVTTTHIVADGKRDEGISPILGDTLRQLPEPRSDAGHHDKQERQACDAHPDDCPRDVLQIPLAASCVQADASFKTPGPQSLPSVCPADAAPASNCAKENSPESKVDSPPEPLESAAEERLVLKDESLSESMHPPVSGNLNPAEQQWRSSSGERGLHGSIHAPASLPQSRLTPNIPVRAASIKNDSFNRNHGRSHTESRSSQPSRSSRSGASSPLGNNVCTHSRNHSTPPAGGSSQKVHHTSRPVITGEAMSKLARTIGGGLGPVSRNQVTFVCAH